MPSTTTITQERSQSFAANRIVLRRTQHSPNHLEGFSLDFFDMPAADWTPEQRTAAQQIRAFFMRRDVQTNIETVPIDVIEELITNIGKLFFLDGLRGMEFFWSGEGYIHQISDEGTLAETYSVLSPYHDIIAINTAETAWQSTPLSARPLLFCVLILHECVHAYLNRFTALEYSNGSTGHGAVWQLLAKTVEGHLHAGLLPNSLIRLYREASLVSEIKEAGKIDMTPERLQECFGDQVTYTLWTGTSMVKKITKVVGPPVGSLMNEHKVLYESPA